MRFLSENRACAPASASLTAPKTRTCVATGQLPARRTEALLQAEDLHSTHSQTKKSFLLLGSLSNLAEKGQNPVSQACEPPGFVTPFLPAACSAGCRASPTSLRACCPFFPSFPYPMATPSSLSFPPTPSLLKYQTCLSNFLQPFPAALPPAHRPAPRCARSSRSPPAQLPTEMPRGTAGAVEVPAARAGASLLKLQKKKR